MYFFPLSKTSQFYNVVSRMAQAEDLLLLLNKEIKNYKAKM